MRPDEVQTEAEYMREQLEMHRKPHMVNQEQLYCFLSRLVGWCGTLEQRIDGIMERLPKEPADADS